MRKTTMEDLKLRTLEGMQLMYYSISNASNQKVFGTFMLKRRALVTSKKCLFLHSTTLFCWERQRKRSDVQYHNHPSIFSN